MSALADALVAAQSRAVAALGKQYVAGKIDGETLRGRLCAIGLTDEVDADQPNKAAAFVRFMDYFWVAAPPSVVRADELPTGWGLLETSSYATRLRQSVKASRLLPEPVDRSFMACLMRAACRGGR